jgi:hypothetical protein
MMNDTLPMRWAWLLGCLFLTSCTIPNPRSCADGTCTDPQFPFCDADGSLAGIPDTCIAVSCAPLEFEACRGDQALVCNATGNSFDSIQCELGCDPAGGCRSRCTLDQDCPATSPVCDEDRTCSTCVADPQCASRPDTPFCDGGACVACVTSAQCDVSSPVCSGNTCRACIRDSECDSGACANDGTCVPEAAIIYMSNASVSEDTCTRTSPCSTLGSASFKITPARNHIVLLDGGTYVAAQLSFGNSDTPHTEVFVHGHGGTLTGLNVATNIINTTKSLLLRELTIANHDGSQAVILRSPSILESVSFVGAGALVVRTDVRARDLRVSIPKAAEAILLATADAELTIERGQIVGGEVGIRATVAGAKVHLENVLIARTRQRALELSLATGELEFSTIADAGAESSAAPCSVACNANLRVKSSIIWQETCANAVRNAAGACTFQSSIVSNGPAPGITNADPQFVNRSGGDYHIKATSPAKDAVETGPALDFEGDARPRGARFDIGADEAP